MVNRRHDGKSTYPQRWASLTFEGEAEIRSYLAPRPVAEDIRKENFQTNYPNLPLNRQAARRNRQRRLRKRSVKVPENTLS